MPGLRGGVVHTADHSVPQQQVELVTESTSVCQASERRYELVDGLTVLAGSVVKTEPLHRGGQRGAIMSSQRREQGHPMPS